MVSRNGDIGTGSGFVAEFDEDICLSATKGTLRGNGAFRDMISVLFPSFATAKGTNSDSDAFRDLMEMTQ